MGLRPRKKPYNRDNRNRDMTLINERIRYGKVRVIDDENQQLGVMETRDAINLAKSKELDLIMVAEKAQPPVCRIMNYGKFKYEKSKRDKGKTKSSATEMKMVRLHPRTGVHDRDILVRHAEKFLRSGHKVRVVCQFRGRENAHPQIGREQLDAVSTALEGIATVEGTINKQGRDMIMYLVPCPGIKPIPKVVKDRSKNKSGKPDEDAAVEEEDDDDLDEYSVPDIEVDDDEDDDAKNDDDESDDAAKSDDHNADENDDEGDGDDESDDDDSEIVSDESESEEDSPKE